MGENRKEKLEDQPRWANIEQRVSERREGINYSPELEVLCSGYYGCITKYSKIKLL